jgi:hypothetical protein
VIFRWGILRALLVVEVFAAPWPALARENLDTEALLANVIQQSAMETQGDIPSNQTWAILPQIGYSPSRRINGGIKFTDRNATAERLTVDVQGNYALELQQTARVAIVAPHFYHDTVIAALEGEYLYDPTKEFFGLGNNDVGPDHAPDARLEPDRQDPARGSRSRQRVPVYALHSRRELSLPPADAPPGARPTRRRRVH